MNILLSIPSRGRPAQLGKTLKQWATRASGADGITVVIGLDQNDPCLPEYEAMMEERGMTFTPGNIKNADSKVHAINETLASAGDDWHIAVIAADDMIPIVDNWDLMIRHYAHEHGLEKLFWFDDGRQNIRCTLPVIGRAWYDARGYVYHPSYNAYYCDDEQTQQAMEAGELIRVMGPMFLHNHACFGAAPNDETYDRNRKYKAFDRRVFQVRKQHSWPAKTPTLQPTKQ